MALCRRCLKDGGCRRPETAPVDRSGHRRWRGDGVRARHLLLRERALVDGAESDGLRLQAVGFENHVGVLQDRRIGGLFFADANTRLIPGRPVPPSRRLVEGQVESREQLGELQSLPSAITCVEVPGLRKAFDLGSQIAGKLFRVAHERCKDRPRIGVLTGLFPAVVGELIAVLDAHGAEHRSQARIWSAQAPELTKPMVDPPQLRRPIPAKALRIGAESLLHRQERRDRASRRDMLARI